MYQNAGNFEYFECPHCKCLQIASVPENLSEYYGTNYYSYNTPEDTTTRSKIEHHKRVLDVGCGAGFLTLLLLAHGCTLRH